jgi:hypothetical protein
MPERVGGGGVPEVLHDYAYLFDTQGYVVLRGILSAPEVRALNASCDHHRDDFEQSPSYAGGSPALSPGGEGPSREGPRGNPLEWPQPWCEPVRECLCHAGVAPFLDLVIGEGWRLDHGPGFCESLERARPLSDMAISVCVSNSRVGG